MAKKAVKKVKAQAAAVAVGSEMPVITIPPGGTLRVVVDVGEMTIPYTVAYNRHTLIKSLVDRAEMAPLAPGAHILGWAFAHTTKGWHHAIGVSVNGGPVQILESKSEAAKDADHSVGVALVRS